MELQYCQSVSRILQHEIAICASRGLDLDKYFTFVWEIMHPNMTILLRN
jgi:hypothetical protein